MKSNDSRFYDSESFVRFLFQGRSFPKINKTTVIRMKFELISNSSLFIRFTNEDELNLNTKC